jgi:hypothetical protein
MYTGTLLMNKIHHYGILKWPDGRCYVGHFQDEMMHGEGMLTWSDEHGLCRYKGHFERNMFQGEGCLEWSNRARYVGQFENGLYHGEGSFEWPEKPNVYKGQWQFGEMSGKGTLTSSGDGTGVLGLKKGEPGTPYVYSGDFRNGNMEGKGTVTFAAAAGSNDQYVGEFKESMFNGLGTFTWGSGTSLSGIFENNYCNRVGKKVYPEGQVYVGELKHDMEDGKGVFTDPGKQRIVGLWKEGKPVEELFESIVPALEVDAVDGEEQKVFGGFWASEGGRPGLPINDENGEPVEGKAIILFLNGDKYIGNLKGGRKHGEGMYVYADLTAYKGFWTEDILNGVKHPVMEDQLPIDVKKLHDLNEKNQTLVEGLKQRTSSNATKAATSS